MKYYILILLLFTTNNTFANPYATEDHYKSLVFLRNRYSDYIKLLENTNNSTKEIHNAEKILWEHRPHQFEFTTDGGILIQLLPLTFFDQVPAKSQNYDPTNPDSESKLFYAEVDRAKLNSNIFMFRVLLLFPKNANLQNYKRLFLEAQKQLLYLAQVASISPAPKAEILSTEFNLIIMQLSRIPFPPEFSYYRRRIAYSIETPDAAQLEIKRLKNSILELTQKNSS